MVLIVERISSMNGIGSPSCTVTKCLLHFSAILIKVSHAISCTPSCVSATKIKVYLRLNAHTRVHNGLIIKYSLTMHELKKFIYNSL